MEDLYLGDGVYASWDGYHIWLDLRAQDTTTRIALDSQVIEALGLFIKAVYAEKANLQEFNGTIQTCSKCGKTDIYKDDKHVCKEREE